MGSIPRDDNRVAAQGVKDSVSGAAVAASGIAVGGIEAQAVAIVDGSGGQIATFPIDLTKVGGTTITTAAALSDGEANPTLGGFQSFPMFLNSSGTWDRAVNAVQAYGTFGAGIGASGMMLESPADFKYYSAYGNTPSNDGIATNAGYGMFGLSFGHLYNGSTWDRIRSVTDGMSTGIQAVGILGFNGTNYNVARNAYQDSQANGETLGAANMLYNGSTWDRMRSGAGTAATGVQRVVLANDAGKTIVSVGGSVNGNGNNTLISAGTNRLKVHAFSLSTVTNTATTCIFQSGASGTELWRVVLQAVAGSSAGANLAVTPPAWLFATASATLLNLNLSSGQTIHWSVSYVDEA